jgi:hypothetical protein
VAGFVAEIRPVEFAYALPTTADLLKGKPIIRALMAGSEVLLNYLWRDLDLPL